MRANPVSSLFLEECRVPATNLLGRVGDGIRIGLATLDTGRIGVAAQALGIAQAAFEEAVRYSKERQQFRSPSPRFRPSRIISPIWQPRSMPHALFSTGPVQSRMRETLRPRSGDGKTLVQRGGEPRDESGGSDPRRVRLQQGIRRGTPTSGTPR